MSWPVLCLGSCDWGGHVTGSAMDLGQPCDLNGHVTGSFMWLIQPCDWVSHVTWKVMWLGQACDLVSHVTRKVMWLGQPCDGVSHKTRKDLGSMLECFYTPLIIDKLPCILLYIAENSYKNSHVYSVWCWMPCNKMLGQLSSNDWHNYSMALFLYIFDFRLKSFICCFNKGQRFSNLLHSYWANGMIVFAWK